MHCTDSVGEHVVRADGMFLVCYIGVTDIVLFSLVNVLVVHVHPVFIFPLSNETGDSTPIGCSTVLVVFTLNGKRMHIS